MKRFQNLRWFAVLCLCLCLLTSSVSAQPQKGAAGGQMQNWDQAQPISFVLDRAEEGVFLTIAPSAQSSGTNILFYLEYDPDEDGKENQIKCYAVTNNSSRDDLGEGLATLQTGVPYEITVQGSTLSLSRSDNDAVLFACAISPEMVPTGGQYPEKTFSQEFAACSQVGLGRWTKGNSGYVYQAEDSLPARGPDDGGVSSSAQTSSQGESAVQSAPPSSAVPQEPSEPIPQVPPQGLPEEGQDERGEAVSVSPGTNGGMAVRIWGNPFLWIGIAAVLVAVVVLIILFLHNRKEKEERGQEVFQQESTPSYPEPRKPSPRAPEAGQTRPVPPRASSRTSRFSDFADLVESSHFRPSSDLTQRMERYDQGDSVFAVPSRHEEPPRPVAAPVPEKPAARESAPPVSQELGIVQELQSLYQAPNSGQRKAFEEQVKTQFLDMDERTSVDLHYGYRTDYRMTVSSRSYIASDYIVAMDQYLLLNYYHYNTQKNNYMLSKSMLEELHVDQVFTIVDTAGRPLDRGAAVGKSIVRIEPAEVRPDGDGYVLVSRGKLQVSG